MKRFRWAGLALILSAAPAFANDGTHPTVVELFQSQGCSSCPPAIANINAIAGRPEILALTFAVTYWDQLGWKDTFAQSAFTDRERAYARAGTGHLATPQIVINGRVAVNGGNAAELATAIRSKDRGMTGPTLRATPRAVTVGAGHSQAATLWLVRYDARALSVPIRAGENSGRTLVHRNIVRSLAAIGTWRGAPITLAIPPAADPNLRSAVLLQAGPGGPILAATRLGR